MLRRTKLSAIAAMAVLVGATQMVPVLAKDVATPSNVPVVTESCETAWNDVQHPYIAYPLVHDSKPGAVSALMKINANSISLVSICLEPGWTYTNQSSTSGVQLRYFYNGARAIDFKFVPGKTDIRSY